MLHEVAPLPWLFISITLPTALLWVVAFAYTLRMLGALRLLSSVPAHAGPPPSVSVVSPACNEAESVEGSVRSWLEQSDVDLQIVMVDDRSTDETPRILDRLAEGDPRVVVTHIDALPSGWLGKVHALHRGAPLATGDWLLFVDADVRLGRGAVGRAIAYAERERVDLVSVYPEIESAGFWGDVVWNALGAGTGLAGMWRTRDPRSERAFATGAFILIRRAAFEATPGFAWLKLEVADDQGLAMLLKSHGHQCDIVNGRGLVRLAWYTSLRDMVLKSQKNWFGIAGRFSLVRCLFIAILFGAIALSPLALLLPGVDPAWWSIPVGGQLALLGAAALQAHWARRPLAPVLLAPIGLLVVVYMLVRAGLVGWRRGGIEWRGVLYSSEVLRGVQRFKM